MGERDIMASPQVPAPLTPEQLALNATKKMALERSTHTPELEAARNSEFRAEQERVHRATNRRLNRHERRKVAAEIAKVERGDYS